MRNHVLSGLVVSVAVLVTGCGTMSEYPWTKTVKVEQVKKQEPVPEVVATPVELPKVPGVVEIIVWNQLTLPPVYLKKSEIPWQKIMECAERGQCKASTSHIWVDLSENGRSIFEASTLVTGKMNFSAMKGSSVKISAVPENNKCQITFPLHNMTHNSGHVVAKVAEDWVQRDNGSAYLQVHMIMRCPKPPAAKPTKQTKQVAPVATKKKIEK